MSEQDKKIAKHNWTVMHLIIRGSSIEIGCGGEQNAVKEAIPVVRKLVNIINNEIKTSKNDLDSKCEFIIHDNYIFINNINGITIQVGWLFTGILYNKKWRYGEIIDFRNDEQKPVNPKYIENMVIERVYMHRW